MAVKARLLEMQGTDFPTFLRRCDMGEEGELRRAAIG
jgi:hypothetical protein